jgi:hypothetical protein
MSRDNGKPSNRGKSTRNEAGKELLQVLVVVNLQQGVLNLLTKKKLLLVEKRQ